MKMHFLYRTVVFSKIESKGKGSRFVVRKRWWKRHGTNVGGGEKESERESARARGSK